MAKVKLNPVVEQMRGRIGDLIFKRYAGEVIVVRKADTTLDRIFILPLLRQAR